MAERKKTTSKKQAPKKTAAPESQTLGKGDWVSFLSQAQISIGQVEYIIPGNDTQPDTLVTTVGAVPLLSVLEVRRAG